MEQLPAFTGLGMAHHEFHHAIVHHIHLSKALYQFVELLGLINEAFVQAAADRRCGKSTVPGPHFQTIRRNEVGLIDPIGHSFQQAQGHSTAEAVAKNVDLLLAETVSERREIGGKFFRGKRFICTFWVTQAASMEIKIESMEGAATAQCIPKEPEIPARAAEAMEA